MVKNRDFVKRMQDYKIRADMKQTVEQKDYSFKPTINRKSAQITRTKTVEELSADYQLYQEKLEKERIENEKKLAELPFKPQLNKNNNSKSFLRLSEEPDTYLQRVAAVNKLKEEKMKALKAQQEIRELESCTFKPITHEAPEYISRIARSMALTK